MEFRYLKGTTDMKVEYSKAGSKHIVGFSDADWGGSKDRFSTSGYVFQMANGPISWKTQKQSTVALSTCEAEYIAVSTASQEAIWYYNLQKELNSTSLVPIHFDNQSAMVLAENNAYSARCKHIDIRYHFIRDILKKAIIELKYIPTDEQTADVLTKGLQTLKQKKMSQLLGLVQVN